MNTESLTTFLILAEERSVTKTAQRLFLVQSTVSSRIQELEKELGQQLFERKPKSMTLTPAGHRLIPLARKMAALEKELRAEAEPRESDRWKLSAGISDSIYYGYVETFLPEFLYRYPDISLSLTSKSSTDMLNMLRDNTLDVCVSLLPGSDPALESVLLSEEDLVLATTINNRDYVDGITPEELLAQKLFYSECFNSSRELVQWRKSVFPDGTCFQLELGVIHQLVSLLERTDGYAFVPRSFIYDQLEHHTLQVIPFRYDPPPKMRFYLTAKKAQMKSYKVSSFLNELQKHIIL